MLQTDLKSAGDVTNSKLIYFLLLDIMKPTWRTGQYRKTKFQKVYMAAKVASCRSALRA